MKPLYTYEQGEKIIGKEIPLNSFNGVITKGKEYTISKLDDEFAHITIDNGDERMFDLNFIHFLFDKI